MNVIITLIISILFIIGIILLIMGLIKFAYIILTKVMCVRRRRPYEVRRNCVRWYTKSNELKILEK